MTKPPFLSRMHLKHFLYSGAFALVFFGAVAAISLILMSTYLHHSARYLSSASESIYLVEELEISLLNHNRESILYDLTKDPQHQIKTQEAQDDILAKIKEMKQYASDDAEKALVGKAEKELNDYLSTRLQLESSGLPPIEIYQQTFQPIQIAYLTLEQIIDLNLQQANELEKKVAWQDQVSDILGGFTVLMLIIVSLILIYGTKRFIYEPLSSLYDAIPRFGKGEYQTRILQQGPVELEKIASMFNEMADNLAKQQETQIQFLAAIAHDLRNPLTPIKLAIESLTEDKDLTEVERSELIKMIYRQIARLNLMIEDFLDRTAIESGQLKLTLESWDIRGIIKECVAIHQILSNFHTLKLNLPDKPVFCLVDSLRINQVVNNLLNNAIKYSPAGGQVTVSLSQEQDEVRIAIKDEGMGISPEELLLIFTPFRRTKSTRYSIPGIGLGLSVSKRIAESHGGRITVESHLGQGSTFYLILPLAS